MREELAKQTYQKQVNRNRKIVGFTKLFMCVLAVGVVLGGLAVNASKPASSYKYYTEIKVGSGDTLWDIANRHVSQEYSSLNEYIDEVRMLNSIHEDEIFYGQRLMIPYYSAEIK